MNIVDQILNDVRKYDFSKPNIHPTSTNEEISFTIEEGETFIEVKAKLLFTPIKPDLEVGISAGFDFLEVDELDINLPGAFITPFSINRIEKFIKNNYHPDIY